MTSFSDTGRAPGTYSYTVKASDAAGNLSDASDAASATVPDSADPTAPTELGATAVSSTRIDLSWQASSDDVGVTGYRIYRGGGQIATVGSDDVVLRHDRHGRQHLQLRGARSGRRGPRVRPEQHGDGDDTRADPGAHDLARGRRPGAAVGSHDELRDIATCAPMGDTGAAVESFLRFTRGGGDGQRAQRQAPCLQLQRHRRRPRGVHDRQLVERDDRELEHPPGPHERLHRRQGGPRREHVGRVRRHVLRHRQRHLQLQPRQAPPPTGSTSAHANTPPTGPSSWSTPVRPTTRSRPPRRTSRGRRPPRRGSTSAGRPRPTTSE